MQAMNGICRNFNAAVSVVLCMIVIYMRRMIPSFIITMKLLALFALFFWSFASLAFPPLHRAVLSDDLLAVRSLVAAGADVRVKHNGCTPLHYAAHSNSGSSIVDELVAAGADVNARDEYGWTPLHDAAHNGNGLPIIEALLAAGADVNAKTKVGFTPLHQAAGHNVSSVVEALLAAGADVNAMDSLHDNTPLHYAARRNNEPAVGSLIAAGADVNAKTRRGKIPSDFAKEEENDAVIPLLEAAGAR